MLFTTHFVPFLISCSSIIYAIPMFGIVDIPATRFLFFTTFFTFVSGYCFIGWKVFRTFETLKYLSRARSLSKDIGRYGSFALLVASTLICFAASLVTVNLLEQMKSGKVATCERNKDLCYEQLHGWLKMACGIYVTNFVARFVVSLAASSRTFYDPSTDSRAKLLWGAAEMWSLQMSVQRIVDLRWNRYISVLMVGWFGVGLENKFGKDGKMESLI